MSVSCDDGDNNAVFLSLNLVKSSLTLSQSRPELKSSVYESQTPLKYTEDFNLDAAQLFTILCVCVWECECAKHQLCLWVQMLEVFSLVCWCTGDDDATKLSGTRGPFAKLMLPLEVFVGRIASFGWQRVICATSLEFCQNICWGVVSEVCVVCCACKKKSPWKVA